MKSPYWSGTVEDQIGPLSGILDDMQVSDVTVDQVAAKRVDGRMKDLGEEGFQFLPADTYISQVIFISGDKMFRLFFQDLANMGNTRQFDRIVEDFNLTN